MLACYIYNIIIILLNNEAIVLERVLALQVGMHIFQIFWQFQKK
jgi:hypothetical protein